ncbi:MAG: hypothetical protein ABIM74_05095 [candidate division WOR-3 bacterium]
MDMKLALLSLAALAASTGFAFATTWAPDEITCPLCGAKNTFYSIMSYGTYIYQWPSKYQLIFWPKTDGLVLWSCKRCKLTAFFWDFENIPDDKKEGLRVALKDVELPKSDDYRGIPMPDRLCAAEVVYRVLGRDDRFWCEFYRVKAYHLDAAGRPEEARAERLKALSLAEEMLKKPENQGTAKELLVITGAMRYFTGDTAGALADLKKARGLTYAAEGMTEEQMRNANEFFDALISEYIGKIESGEEIPKQ